MAVARISSAAITVAIMSRQMTRASHPSTPRSGLTTPAMPAWTAPCLLKAIAEAFGEMNRMKPSGAHSGASSPNSAFAPFLLLSVALTGHNEQQRRPKTLPGHLRKPLTWDLGTEPASCRRDHLGHEDGRVLP